MADYWQQKPAYSLIAIGLGLVLIVILKRTPFPRLATLIAGAISLATGAAMLALR